MKRRRACPRSRHREAEEEEGDGVTEEEGVPEAGAVTQQGHPLRETFVKMNKQLREKMHEMAVYFLYGRKNMIFLYGPAYAGLTLGFRLLKL